MSPCLRYTVARFGAIVPVLVFHFSVIFSEAIHFLPEAFLPTTKTVKKILVQRSGVGASTVLPLKPYCCFQLMSQIDPKAAPLLLYSFFATVFELAVKISLISIMFPLLL